MQIIIATPAPIAEVKRALEGLGIATHPTTSPRRLPCSRGPAS